MSYLGDYVLGATVSCRFTTVQATGAPTTLSGSPVISCYPSGSTTEITGGITLTVDYDSRTGFNNVAIVASSGNTFAVNTDYDIVITTGTVNSVSVVGYVVGTFSIQNRFTNVAQWNGLATVALPLVPTIAGRTLDVSGGGEAGVDWANVGSPTTAVDLSGTNIKTNQKVDVDTIKTNPVVNGGTLTFPTNKTLASTDNITAASGVVLTAAYDAAKTAAQAGNAMTLTAAYDAAKTAAQASDIPSAATNAAAVQTSAATTPLPANLKKINGTPVNGDGSATPWGP